MAIYDEQFLKSLGTEPYANGKRMAEVLLQDTRSGRPYSEIVAGFEFLHLWLLEQGLMAKDPRPEFTRDEGKNRESILNYLIRCIEQLSPEAHARAIAEKTESAVADGRQRFAQFSAATFAYRFSESDFTRLQELINKLRELLVVSIAIPEDHRQRLLLKLEALQRELHRQTTTLDKAWALVMEIGFTAMKVGEGAKEVAKVTSDIARILTLVAATAHGLPSLLPPPIEFKPPELPPSKTDSETPKA